MFASLAALAALAVETSPIDPVASLLAVGPVGVVVVLIVTGWLITRSHADDLRAVGTEWKRAYEQERHARTVEHEARERAERVAERSLEQGRVLVTLMTKIQDRMDRGVS